MAIEKTMSHVEREIYENEINQMRQEIERLKAELAATRRCAACKGTGIEDDYFRCKACGGKGY